MQFGPYRVGETVGRGSMATVKVAVHERTNTKVALKIISRETIEKHFQQQQASQPSFKAATPGALSGMGSRSGTDTAPASPVPPTPTSTPRAVNTAAAKIALEIKVLRTLKHPHILRLYDVIFKQKDIVLVLEYVSGGELFEHLNSFGRLPESQARALFQQIVSALEYCHANGIAHRDLKPENIFLDRNCTCVKLGDFDLSGIIGDGTFFDVSCGTPSYAAPEVIGGKLYSGPEADAWSAGVVLYAMVTGRLPFDDENVQTLFRKIKEGTFSVPAFVSPAARDLLRRLIVVDPLQRATIAQVQSHPWVRSAIPRYLLAIHAECVASRADMSGVLDVGSHAGSLPADMGASPTMHSSPSLAGLSAAGSDLDEEVSAAVAKEFRCSVLEVEESIERALAFRDAAQSYYLRQLVLGIQRGEEPTPGDKKTQAVDHDRLVAYSILMHKKRASAAFQAAIRHRDTTGGAASGSARGANSLEDSTRTVALAQRSAAADVSGRGSIGSLQLSRFGPPPVTSSLQGRSSVSQSVGSLVSSATGTTTHRQPPEPPMAPHMSITTVNSDVYNGVSHTGAVVLVSSSNDAVSASSAASDEAAAWMQTYRVGVLAEGFPAPTTFTRVFAVLKRQGFLWKVLRPFHVCALSHTTRCKVFVQLLRCSAGVPCRWIVDVRLAPCCPLPNALGHVAELMDDLATEFSGPATRPLRDATDT